MSTGRILYSDNRPYVVPETLQELTGPTGGVVVLPQSLVWSGRRSYDLDLQADRLWCYKRVLEQAQTVEDLRRFVNAAVLGDLWSSLPLARRVRALWEDRFPQLAAVHRSAS